MKAPYYDYGFAEPKLHPTALGLAQWPASAKHTLPIRMQPAGAPISHALAERSRTFRLAGIAHAGKGDPIRFLIRVCAATLKTATYSLSPCSPSVQQFSVGPASGNGVQRLPFCPYPQRDQYEHPQG